MMLLNGGMKMLLPNHTPKLEKLGIGFESDAVETTLTYEEVLEWLTKNNLPHTEESAGEFLVAWYLKYRDTSPNDYMEHKIENAFDNN